MSIVLPSLPYKKGDLSPHISEETLDYHYGKHHRAYVDKLNAQIKGTKWENASLSEIVKGSEAGVFNNSAQVWNHNFYWDSLSPKGGGEPQGALKSAIEESFQSFDKFKELFNAKALGQFGSGWAWLVKEGEEIKILTSSNADNPLKSSMPSSSGPQKALFCCDVWEHAYYIDYRNKRAEYLSAFWHLVNWEFASKNFLSS